MDRGYLVEECASVSIGSIKHDHRFVLDAGGESVTFDTGSNAAPQQIALAAEDITFGTRHYFLCGCGSRVSKLYLPPNKKEYRCRSCYGLRYELAVLSRTSAQGKLLYRTNRMLKLSEQRAHMNRIFYRGAYTRRFDRFLQLCLNAGLLETVREAMELEAAVASQ